MQIGKIIKINKDIFFVLINNKVYECYTRGKLKYTELVVGDNVKIDLNNNTIEELLPRSNLFIRPLISNIDKLIIVISCKEPEFSSFLLDKFLVLSTFYNVKAIIVFTKYDLLNFNERKIIKKYIKYYKKIGYKIYINKDYKKIKKEFKNSVVSLAGQTGVGKSTLLNKIDKNLNLKTDNISISLGRGKHTTRIVQLFNLNNGLVADTPGFSSLELPFKKEEIKNGFIEFSNNCKYRSCLHYKEDGCKIKDDVRKGKIIQSRYINYIKLLNEVK